MGENLHVCGYERCGRSFNIPLRLTDFSHRPHAETYSACPYCFSKVDENEHSDTKLFHSGGYEISTHDDAKNQRGGEHKKPGKTDTVEGCPHSMGYLKTRSKDQAIPDGCFTCPNILQCMA
jgi:DNA-directed RNA polymerase subunit RPC12/RpoP